ncbi:conserved hypothetical protein [Paraburkholderia phymatum STM815]|uniref:Tail fiber protein n=1 Tax=Paraburkholderia phymatum (strain DSM 17167 / CIP 108236 / LMG 21445 / STM815) TaxID=391038 RepID=B2JCZ1_PARP8|nr:conserved hypothetical protein [Paraburkholderia phymatum STM815]
MDRLIASNTVAVGSGDTAPATGTPGQATSGNPATNTPATVFPAYAWNAIQEEMIAILAAAGITPDRNNNAQIVAAIKALCGPGRLLNGGPTVYTAGATWNRNPATTFLIVEIQAPGGGSAGAPATGASQYAGSPGASSGSYAKVLLTAAQAGASQTITAGAPGAAGPTGSGAGGTGGTASFGSIITCPGGLGSSSYGPTGTTTSIQNAPSAAGLPTITAGIVLTSTPGNTGGYAIGTLTGVASAQGGAAPINGSTTSEGSGGRGTGIGASTSAVAGAVGGGPKIIVWEFA